MHQFLLVVAVTTSRRGLDEQSLQRVPIRIKDSHAMHLLTISFGNLAVFSLPENVLNCCSFLTCSLNLCCKQKPLFHSSLYKQHYNSQSLSARNSTMELDKAVQYFEPTARFNHHTQVKLNLYKTLTVMFFCKFCNRPGDMDSSSFSHDLNNASD